MSRRRDLEDPSELLGDFLQYLLVAMSFAVVGAGCSLLWLSSWKSGAIWSPVALGSLWAARIFWKAALRARRAHRDL